MTMDITRILVPVDFSQGSAKVLEYAGRLARVLGGEIELLHVVPDPLQQPWAIEAVNVDFRALRDEWLQHAEVHMQQFVASHPSPGGPPRFTIRVGGSATEIVAAAEEKTFDVIVMGAHGHGRLTTLLLGSTAERVVRDAPCPVVTVREQAGRVPAAGEDASSPEQRAGDIQTILIPTDFSEVSQAAVTYGCALAERLGARSQILAIVESPWTRDVAYVPPPPEMVEDLRRLAELKLSRTVEELRPLPVAAVLVRVGEPFDQILRVAEEIDADLIVMGTHARGLAGRMLLGSIAQKVLHAAPCPVLTLRDRRSIPNRA
jgi:nucleotide-binding universal stress UspA family protein